ncbi:MAG: transposase [Chlorobium sp.]|uniref:transposase n=1 Tax=Chlorobium sp. TaxID=1095 RepID=UPI0025C2B4AD|nr:transposase [Chlorobium sp.]MCF8384051.1 transposase [Chlorobium sp.]
MPRGARLDAPGALHHVMVRGIERTAIVFDDEDRLDFLNRIDKASDKTGTVIYAWALMTNHAHLLLRSGLEGLPTFMRKVLTGYSVSFNKRHHRVGHLFQNRYKSILCEEEPYFIKLVSYIHLNPLRAGLVASQEELERYPWSGHAAIMGLGEHTWQDTEYVLQQFGRTTGAAREAYVGFVLDQMRLGHQPELTGGGLVRSAGGWSEVLSMRQRGERQFSDERILGSGEFVEEVLGDVEELQKEMVPMRLRQVDAHEMLERQCAEKGLSVEALQAGSRNREYSSIRRELARKFVIELGLSHADAARLLGISRAGVSMLIRG